MKNKYLIFILIGVVILIVTAILLCRPKDERPTEIGKIKSFDYGYSVGYAMWSNVKYKIDCEADGCNAVIKLNGVPEEEQVETVVDRNIATRIEEIMTKYKVGKWNGFNKSDKYVLDGNSFHLYVHFENGDSISASGYMMWPKNYREFKSEIDALFEEVLAIQNKE